MGYRDQRGIISPPEGESIEELLASLGSKHDLVSLLSLPCFSSYRSLECGHTGQEAPASFPSHHFSGGVSGESFMPWLGCQGLRGMVSTKCPDLRNQTDSSMSTASATFVVGPEPGCPGASISESCYTLFSLGRRLTALAFFVFIQANVPEETLETSPYVRSYDSASFA